MLIQHGVPFEQGRKNAAYVIMKRSLPKEQEEFLSAQMRDAARKRRHGEGNLSEKPMEKPLETYQKPKVEVRWAVGGTSQEEERITIKIMMEMNIRAGTAIILAKALTQQNMPEPVLIVIVPTTIATPAPPSGRRFTRTRRHELFGSVVNSGTSGLAIWAPFDAINHVELESG